MLVYVKVSVGDPDSPLAGFSKEEFVYSDAGVGQSVDQITRDQLASLEAALGMIDEAKASLERQARAASGALGSGPQE